MKIRDGINIEKNIEEKIDAINAKKRLILISRFNLVAEAGFEPTTFGL